MNRMMREGRGRERRRGIEWRRGREGGRRGIEGER